MFFAELQKILTSWSWTFGPSPDIEQVISAIIKTHMKYSIFVFPMNCQRMKATLTINSTLLWLWGTNNFFEVSQVINSQRGTRSWCHRGCWDTTVWKDHKEYHWNINVRQCENTYLKYLSEIALSKVTHEAYQLYLHLNFSSIIWAF